MYKRQVHNVDTIVSIYEAVIEGRPLYTRIVTITGDAIENPCNLMAVSYTHLLLE